MNASNRAGYSFRSNIVLFPGKGHFVKLPSQALVGLVRIADDLRRVAGFGDAEAVLGVGAGVFFSNGTCTVPLKLTP